MDAGPGADVDADVDTELDVDVPASPVSAYPSVNASSPLSSPPPLSEDEQEDEDEDIEEEARPGSDDGHGSDSEDKTASVKSSQVSFERLESHVWLTWSRRSGSSSHVEDRPRWRQRRRR
jgi:hypothetical protein